MNISCRVLISDRTLHPGVEQEILPYCQQQNIGVIVYSPMAPGMLTGRMTRERIQQMPDDDWRKNSPDYQEPRLTRNLDLARLLQKIGQAHNVPAGVVAIAWTLRNPAVTAAIVGARRPNQIEELAAAADFRLSKSEEQEIEDFLASHP